MTLKELRTEVLRLRQIDFAEMLGVSLRTYIRYEQKGAPMPVIMLANRIAHDALNRHAISDAQ